MWQHVTPSEITDTLCIAVYFLGLTIVFLSKYFYSISLCGAVFMALLKAHMDGDIIFLVGGWRSNAMLRYLHVQGSPMEAAISVESNGVTYWYYNLTHSP